MFIQGVDRRSRDFKVFLPSYNLIENATSSFKTITFNYDIYGLLSDTYMISILNLDSIPHVKLIVKVFEIQSIKGQETCLLNLGYSYLEKTIN